MSSYETTIYCSVLYILYNKLGMKTIGRNIKIRRTHAGLTQGELAKRVGTYQVRIHRIEHGKATPTAEELKVILKILIDE